MTNTELKSILEAHRKWLNGEPNGCRANLLGADLCYANLSDADLSDVKNVDKMSWNIYTGFYPLQCPEEGGHTGLCRTTLSTQ